MSALLEGLPLNGWLLALLLVLLAGALLDRLLRRQGGLGAAIKALWCGLPWRGLPWRGLPWSRRRRPRSPVRGLNYLLNEEPDADLDTLVAGLEVSEATLDAHLALGTLVRKRGEIDRAIRFHQGMLANTRLGAEGRGRVELELARDYLAAGLLNRAESLLNRLLQRRSGLREAALEQMLEVHQRERNWQAAAEVARQLLGQGGAAASRTLAHYLCELAEDAWQAGDLSLARHHLSEALKVDPDCVRASMIGGELELEAGRYREAIAAMQRVRHQDPRFLPQLLPLLLRAHRELGSERDLLRFLDACLAEHPSATLAAERAARHLEAGDVPAARRLLADSLRRRPNLRGLELLLAQYGGEGEGASPNLEAATAEALASLREHTASLLAGAEPYLCHECGLRGRVLHWHCPSCKRWGSTTPRDDLFGD